jgi:signal peptidase I
MSEPGEAGAGSWRRWVFGKSPRRTVVRSILLLAGAWITFKFLLVPIRVTGISMEPTFQNQSIHVLNRVGLRWRNPRRGDVVGIQTTGPTVIFLKRVVGLPGERVAIVRNVVFINGKPLQEPYVRHWNEGRPWNRHEVELRPDEFFVIGDNRGMDQQWHDFGEVERWRLFGYLLF